MPRANPGGATVSPALGPQPHCCHGDEYHTESSRGSDLSDILEEDEEELCSEMQLEDGGRRRPSGTSHSALKVSGQGHRFPLRRLGLPFSVPPWGPRPAVWTGVSLGAELVVGSSPISQPELAPKVQEEELPRVSPSQGCTARYRGSSRIEEHREDPRPSLECQSQSQQPGHRPV